MSGDHDENLDSEIARIQADAEVRIAEAKGRVSGGGTAAVETKRRDADPDDAPEGEGHGSWDDFWSEVERAEAAERGEQATEVIRGVRVNVPYDLPLRFQRRLDQVQTAERQSKAVAAELAAQAAALRAREARGEDITAELEQLQAREIDAADDTRAKDDTTQLLSDLFGADVLDRWVDEGMTEKEFQVVLLWGMAHGKGQPMTFREAYDAYRRAEGNRGPAGPGAGGAAPAGSSKPNAKKKRPAATGGRSKATSDGSTGSPRATSRT